MANLILTREQSRQLDRREKRPDCRSQQMGGDRSLRGARPVDRDPGKELDQGHRLAASRLLAERLAPEPALIPSDPELRGRCIWYEEFADTIFAACGAKMFFNRIVAPVFLKRPGDLQVAESAERDELPGLLDYVESIAPEGDGYLVGDGLTLADIAVAGPFVNLAHLKVAIDPKRWPRTLAYTGRILARPSFEPWIAREAGFLRKVQA